MTMAVDAVLAGDCGIGWLCLDSLKTIKKIVQS